ncbi:MAG: HEPN domain-containing protein [Phycisphaerae bacterium]
MTGKEFIGVAQELIGGSAEAHWRSAVSRAYYAAFHVVGMSLGVHLKVPKGPSAHGWVRNCLLNSQNSALEAAGSKLADLHRQRLNADYRLHFAFMQGTARAFVESAKRVITQVENSLTGAGAARIVVAIRDYLRITNQPGL